MGKRLPPPIGAEVMIFEDPVTRQKEEGRAIILEEHDIDDYYRVRFLSDNFECDRFILYFK